MRPGLIGLINAAKNFDSSRGLAFSTFAVQCIRNAVGIEWRKMSAESRKSNENTISLSTPMVEGDENTALENSIPDKFDMQEHIEKEEEKELLYRAISSLTKREQDLIKWYYIEELNQEQVAKLDGTSQANVSRQIIKAVNKLRKYMNEDEMFSKYRRIMEEEYDERS